MQPLISIGIPTHNRADTYFRLTLESALAQSYAIFEVIVADNASTDGTRELVAGYDDSRLRYYRHDPALHYNENFNFCLSQARGEYFQLLHDDDLIDPTFLQRCAEVLAGRDAVVILPVGSMEQRLPEPGWMHWSGASGRGKGEAASCKEGGEGKGK